ncbi:hypothetical protein GGD56_003339 [Rhizobium mongolense]|uniref:Uncharacterized protein n=2 Tax=Rhizobium mongolense TaxID=57676 RepID=A0ABR6IPF9_9HYPH|nr:hypothetical protein [Rhizobium mongolense]TVZ73345.1 hypothetical protein BCL32_1565 [Rhizobium mongolense USDA 1844]
MRISETDVAHGKARRGVIVGFGFCCQKGSAEPEKLRDWSQIIGELSKKYQ